MATESHTPPMRLLSVKEAARYLSLRPDTLYKKARYRKIPTVRIGRALRFDIRMLDRFVDEHSVKARAGRDAI